MKKLSSTHPNRTSDRAEFFAAVCVLIIFMTCLIWCHVALIWVRELGPPKTSISWRAAGEITSHFLALIISWFVSVHLGNWLTGKFLGQTLKAAVSTVFVMRALGLPSVKAFYNFARLHNLSVYRVKEEMGVNEDELQCCRVPLFGTWLYSPIVRRQLFADNLLYLDKDAIQPILTNMAKSLAHTWPDTVNAAVNVEQEKQIQALQKRLDEVNSKLGDKNRSEGPYANASRHKLFLLAQLFVCFLLHEEIRNKRTGGGKMTKEQLNGQYKLFLTERGSLADFLSLLKPDASREALHPDVADLLRLSMKPGTVSWGGGAGTSFAKIIKNVMTDSERASFDDKHGWILK